MEAPEPALGSRESALVGVTRRYGHAHLLQTYSEAGVYVVEGVVQGEVAQGIPPSVLDLDIIDIRVRAVA